MPPQERFEDKGEAVAFWIVTIFMTAWFFFAGILISPLLPIIWVALMTILFTGKMLFALRKTERITDPFPDLAE